MVMHARKISRFNDGYYDRNQTHPFEDKYPSKSHGSNYNDRFPDRSRESPNFVRGRDESPSSRPSPRYQNKSSYMERTKNRMDKGSSNSPADRRVNHYPSASTSQSFDSDRHSNYDKKDGRDNSEKDQKEKDQRIEFQKTAIQLCGDWSEYLSSSGKSYYYNFKTEVSQWGKPKDWNDISASRPDQRGKDRNGRDRQQIQVLGSTKASEERHKHSISNEHRPVERERCLKAITTVSTPQRSSMDRQSSGGMYMYTPSSSSTSSHPSPHGGQYMSSGQGSYNPSTTPSSFDSRHRQSSNYHGDSNHAGYPRPELVQHKSWHGQEYRDRERDHGHRGRDSHRTSTSSESYSHSHERERYERVRDYDTRPRTNYSAAQGSAMSAHNGARSGDSYKGDHEDSREAEDMDISPGSTPTSSRSNSRPGSRQGTPHVPATSTPVSVTTPTIATGHTPHTPKSTASIPHGNHNADSADFTKQAIETLQRLQEALLAQQAQQLQQQRLKLHHQRQATAQAQALAQAQANAAAHSPNDASDATPPYTEPSPKKRSSHGHGSSHRSSHRDSHRGGDSPQSDRSVRSSRHGSPTPSQSSSQSVSLSRRVSAAGPKKQESTMLTPSLSNYVNQRLTEHVSGWQADCIERQTSRYTEEAHTVGSLHCTAVSAELKKARSLVRIAEIQSTLHEQRILFLRQQIKELENLRSQNTYYQDT